jgi:hypothetical protein
MDTTGETLSLEYNQFDDLVKKGINYGLLIKTFRGEELTSEEESLKEKLTQTGSNRMKERVSLVPEEAALALVSLERNKELLERTDSWGDDDRIAWTAIPEIGEFVTRHGLEVATS